MKDKLKKIKDIILLDKFQSTANIRKLCLLVGFTNIVSCIIFYIWLIVHKNLSSTLTQADPFKNLLVIAVLTHTYLNVILIRWTQKYHEATWKMWAWLSLMCVSPLGLRLIFLYQDEKIWKEEKIASEKTESIMNSLTTSVVNLNNSLNKAIEFLNNRYPEDFQKFLSEENLNLNDIDSWNNKEKYLVIAIYEAMKQTKKKNTFEDIEFKARWYEQRFFDFAIKDPKKKIMPHLRYQYSIGFIVLDEFNNYQKILNGKKEIKANMKFGTAKAICLHWGKGFKVFVNE